MNFKKVVAGVLAGSMVAAMSVVPAFADDTYTAWLEGQFNVEVNADFGEWTSIQDISTVTGTIGKETTIKVTFDSEVAFAGNYVGIPTDIPYTDDAVASVKSVKINGTDLAVADVVNLSAEAPNDCLRITLTNLWNADITTQTVASDAYGPMTTFEVTFVVGEEASDSGDVAPVAYMAALVAVAGVAMAVSKAKRA